MKHSTIMLLCTAATIFSCNVGRQETPSPAEPRTAVELTRGVYGHIGQTRSFPAVTAYRRKASVAAPCAGFITETAITAGDRLRKGQELFRLESRERHATGGTGDEGTISIQATSDGTVLEVFQQSGSYVQEGVLLCTAAEASSLVFEIHIPFELGGIAKKGTVCTIELPDGAKIKAAVKERLATMDTVSQTEYVSAVPLSQTALPEGLTARAHFTVPSHDSGRGLLLLRSAVQSDEVLSQHYVMKLDRADSTAVKVPVEIVGSNSEEVEVRSMDLTDKDEIIATGGYGLEDGAKVTF